MGSGLQDLQKTRLGGGGENLRLERHFGQQILEDFQVELGVDIVQEKDRRLLESPPEKLQLGELQEEHDHLHLAAAQHLRRRAPVDGEVEQIALRSGQR